MEFTVDCLILAVDQLEGVAPIAVHPPETIRGTAVREQEGHLVGALRPQRQEVPEHIRIL